MKVLLKYIGYVYLYFSIGKNNFNPYFRTIIAICGISLIYVWLLCEIISYLLQIDFKLIDSKTSTYVVPISIFLIIRLFFNFFLPETKLIEYCQDKKKSKFHDYIYWFFIILPIVLLVIVNDLNKR